MIKLLCLLMLASSSVWAELPKERRLRKLSMHIRGMNPSAEDYKKLAAAQNTEKFFSDITSEYLSSKEHTLKMNYRLDQLFRLGQARFYSGMGYQFEQSNALNDLFKTIVEENLSWDELLVGKKYKLTMSSQGFSDHDFGFLGAVLPFRDYPRSDMGILTNSEEVIHDKEETDEYGNKVEKNGVYSREHEFAPQDDRIAGALTTQRFFRRYVNTAINKNRGRAAAVFRIFLCDDMEAAIVDSSDRTDYLLDFVFPDTTGMSNQDVVSVDLASSAHGQRPDCMACHYKLDPMGKNFGGSGVSLAPVSFKGALSYQTSEGEKVNIPTNGLGDLARKLVQQKDYKMCQTQHFWKWFIGEDVELTKSTQAELLKAYDQYNGRVNDFIHYLVSRKEFYQSPNVAGGAK